MKLEDWTQTRLNELSYSVIGCAMEVHKFFGPGLLEENYEDCLTTELDLQGIAFERQVGVELIYKDQIMPKRYRLDLVVEGILIVELKAVKELLPIHEAQILTYLKLTKKPKGLLINFNTKFLQRGKSWITLVRRHFNELPD